jgi:DNA-binding transcriptional LysR family regulator
VSSATLSRHILSLEKSLKVVLFTRRTSGLSLTADGEKLLQQCKQIQSIITNINEHAVDDQAEQEIRVASIPCLAHFKLIPAMSSFNKQWPNLKLVLNSSPELSEFGESSIDVAIRLSRPESGRYLVRRISQFGLAAYQAKDKTLNSGSPVPLILWGSFQGYSSRVNDALMQVFPDHRVAMLSNSLFDIIQAINSGLGIGYLPEYVASHYPDLQRIREVKDLPAQDVWMVIKEEAERRRCVREFADHLVEHIENPLIA